MATQQRVSATPPLADAVAAELRAAARGAGPAITAVYMTPDGTAFALTGPTWTEELSLLGGHLAAELQEQLAPDGVPYLDGGFWEAMECPVGWLRVY